MVATIRISVKSAPYTVYVVYNAQNCTIPGIVHEFVQYVNCAVNTQIVQIFVQSQYCTTNFCTRHVLYKFLYSTRNFTTKFLCKTQSKLKLLCYKSMVF